MLTQFQKAVRKEFSFLKEASNLEALFARGLALPQTGGLAVPLARVHHRSGLAQKVAASAGRSIEFCVEAPDFAAFVILDRTGATKGWLTLKVELDRVVMANFGGASTGGEMADGVRELVRWCEETLWPEQVVASRQALQDFFAESAESLPILDRDEFGSTGLVRLSRQAGRRTDANMILTAGPSVSMREAVYTLDAAKYGWNNQWAKYLKLFERSFAEYIGVRYALATSSCTGALHLSLLALDIGPGDEVIVPDITWVATGNAVLYAGATPIFADVDPTTWCLDPESFRSLITPRTKAVMPVHLYGHPCEMDKIMQVAAEHHLRVIEDAAPSIGAEYQGKRTGSYGHFAAFSFQGAKLAVTGEGGMLVTDDENLFKKAHAIWDQGRKPGTFWIERLGWKYKMANMLAAFGLGQLERNDAMVEAKRRIFRWYDEGLKGMPFTTLNREAAQARSIYWMSSLLLDEAAPLDRDTLIVRLKERNIDTRPVFPAISQYPIWPKKQAPQPNAHRIGQRAINLPSGVCLSREEVDYVCASIRELVTVA